MSTCIPRQTRRPTTSILLLDIFFVFERRIGDDEIAQRLADVRHAVDGPRRGLRVAVLVDLDLAVLAGAHHDVLVDVHPEADAGVALDALHDLLALDVPEHDLAVLARGRDEGRAVDRPETAPYAEPFVLVARVRLLDGSGDVVPEAQARVEAEGQDVSAVGREAYGCDGRVVLVY